MKTRQALYSAALLCTLAGSLAFAQTPVIDGRKGTDNYGPAKWVNTTNPTQFGDSTALTLSGAPLGDPAAVNRGIEIAIPLADIGNYVPGTPLKLCAFVISGNQDFLSNQFAGPLAENSENPGDPREVNLNTAAFPGNQYITFTPAVVATAPTIDGQLDASYGAFIPGSLQTCGTSFGNNNTATAVGGGGSEIDAVYAVVSGTNLHIFVAGNLEANFNKLQVYLDTVAGDGQNKLTGNPNGPARLSDNDASGAGLTFDTGFEPDFWINVNGGGNPAAFYVDYCTLPSGGFGSFFYCGTAGYGNTVGTLTGGDAFCPVIRASIDNSNTAGVVGGNTGNFVVRPHPDRAAGSEVDAVYSKISGDKLYVLVTGNLETNFNKFNLFFAVDGVAGQNRLRAAGDSNNLSFRPNPDIAFNSLQKMGTTPAGTDPSLATNGLKFDDGFEASYFLSINNSANPASVFLDGAVLRASGRRQTAVNGNTGGKALDYGAFDGGRKSRYPVISYDGNRADQQTNPPVGGLDNIYTNYAPRSLADNIDQSANAGSFFPWLNNNLASVAGGKVLASIDNSNVLGVTDTVADQAAAEAVSTGTEIAIALSELGVTDLNNIPRIRLAGFVNNNDFTFVSNQVLGGLPSGNGNLGDPRAVDFSAIAGNQYVTLYAPPQVGGCNPADIACDSGVPLAQDPGCTNSNLGPNEGDYNAFFAADGFFFQAGQGPAAIGSFCDIACDSGDPLAGNPGCTNNGVNEGDFNCFFNNLFLPCV
ncbi:MAG: hypothetical protein IBJ18_01815 [Phycisphaerales bacterium]|nr:hypothetical protein [Phycisphaerales bacterium]